MMKRHLLISLICLLVMASCSVKTRPEDEIEEQVFSVNGMIDNTVRALSAGSDDFFMETDFNLNPNDVVEFTGELKKTCAGCNEGLKIVIRNYRKNENSWDYNPDQALHAAQYPFFGTPSAYRVIFKSEPQGQGSVTHFWDFGDGTQSSQAKPAKTFNATGKYLITYRATYPGGCSSITSYPVNLSRAVSGMNNLGFGHTYLGNNVVLLSTDSVFGKVMWDLGDGNYSNSHNEYVNIASGVRKITLMKFVGNDTIQVSKNIASENYLMCNANMSHFIAPDIDPGGLSTVTIEWTDAQGIKYSSDNAVQDASDGFHILTVSDYLPNKHGKKTRKLGVAFSCNASDGTRTIRLENMQGSIGVALP